MSFKDEYDKFQRQIAPDKEFLERLAEKMDAEKQVKKKRIKIGVGVFSAAAVCAAAALIIVVNTGKTPEPFPDIIGVGADKIEYVEGLFPYDSSASGDIAELAEILADSETTVYGSRNTTFDFDDKLDETEKNALAEKLRNAVPTDEAPNGGAMNYMASYDGKVVKFSVTGDILSISENNFKI